MTDTASISRGSIGGPWRIAARLPNGTLPDLPGDYTCKLKVLGSAIERTITAVVPDDDGTPNKRFLVNLTKEETTGLTVGSLYRRVIQIESVSAGICEEDILDFTVSPGGIEPSDPFTPQTKVERLTAELAEMRAARLAFMNGGTVKQAGSGRYGNQMTFENPTLKDYNEMIAILESDLDAELRIAAGGRRRGGIGLVWTH